LIRRAGIQKIGLFFEPRQWVILGPGIARQCSAKQQNKTKPDHNTHHPLR